jgi:two-component system chemotaxis response regulator CheB
VLGVVLTGMLDDGVAGLRAIHRRGGRTMVQDPRDAMFDSMPRHALEQLPVDEVVPLAGVGPAIARLAGEPVDPPAKPDGRMEEEMNHERGEPTDLMRLGRLTPFTCPECSGSLFEIEDEGEPRYRCHVGHGYSSEDLVADQDLSVEAALWAGLRMLREHGTFQRRLAERVRERRPDLAERLDGRARINLEHADHLLRIVQSTEPSLEE